MHILGNGGYFLLFLLSKHDFHALYHLYFFRISLVGRQMIRNTPILSYNLKSKIRKLLEDMKNDKGEKVVHVRMLEN
jgi:hypothetical protein